MDFFDCNVCYGAAMNPPLKQSETADELLEEMDFCGVTEALTYHAAQRDDWPGLGNPLLSDEIEVKARLHPTWAILPPQTEELGTVDDLFQQMKARGVKALRAFPTHHRYQLNATTFRELFRRMVDCNVPLIVPGDWTMLESLMCDCPELTVLAVQPSNHSQDRFFRPIVERYPNFYVDTTRYQCDGGMAAFCRKYGPGRLVFGSGYPDLPMGAAVLQVLHADLPDSEKEAIAGDNLRRLLGEVQL